jgi:hypothetical protein
MLDKEERERTWWYVWSGITVGNDQRPRKSRLGVCFGANFKWVETFDFSLVFADSTPNREIQNPPEFAPNLPERPLYLLG